MSETSPASRPIDSRKPSRSELPSAWRVWGVAWLSTALAGGAFGLLFEGFLGFVFGFVIALFVAMPVFALFAIVTSALRLSRYTLIAAGLAGASTGYISVFWLDGSTFETIGAVLVGGTFSFIGCAVFLGEDNWPTLRPNDRDDLI